MENIQQLYIFSKLSHPLLARSIHAKNNLEKSDLHRHFYISFTSSCFAENLSAAELDALVKEDIAAAQVLTEICPAFIGNTAKFNANISAFTQSNLKRLSQPISTLEQIKQDPVYKEAYAEAKQSLNETDREEQKSSCEEVLDAEFAID